MYAGSLGFYNDWAEDASLPISASYAAFSAGDVLIAVSTMVSMGYHDIKNFDGFWPHCWMRKTVFLTFGKVCMWASR